VLTFTTKWVIRFQIPELIFYSKKLSIGFASKEVITPVHPTFGITEETGTRIKM